MWGSITLFKAVFINPEQVVRFYACMGNFDARIVKYCHVIVIALSDWYHTLLAQNPRVTCTKLSSDRCRFDKIVIRMYPRMLF